MKPVMESVAVEEVQEVVEGQEVRGQFLAEEVASLCSQRPLLGLCST